MFAIVQGDARRVRLNVTNSLGYFLIKFTNQYNLDEVLAVFQNLGSTLKPIVLITDSGGYGTPNPLDGEVNLNVIGNWEAKIYSQSSATNLNVDLATNLLSTTTVFVQGDSSCVVNPRNTPLIRTCQDVKDCIGISSTGDSAKYLNERGNWVSISGTGGTEITNTTIQDLLELNDNWENPLRPFINPVTADYYYPFYTGTAITGQSENDYYIGIDTFTLSICKYELVKIAGVLTAIRTHIQQK